MSRKGVEEGRKCKKQALVQLFTKHGTRKGYTILFLQISMYLNNIYSPRDFSSLIFRYVSLYNFLIQFSFEPSPLRFQISFYHDLLNPIHI